MLKLIFSIKMFQNEKMNLFWFITDIRKQSKNKIQSTSKTHNKKKLLNKTDGYC